MKFLKFLSLFVAAASCLHATNEIGVITDSNQIGDLVKFGQKSYMVVYNFNSYPKYEEFQRNQQIMKNMNAAISALSAKIESEKDQTKRDELAAQLKQLKEEFEINDRVMQKGYNFASNRQYLMMFLKTNICVPISNEEFSVYKLKDGSKIDPLNIVSQNGIRFMRKTTLQGLEQNEEFQRILRYVMLSRNEMAELRTKLDNNTDMEELSKISERLIALEKSLKENEEIMLKKYGLKDGQTYMVEVERSDLLLLLTPEESMKIETENSVKKTTPPSSKAENSKR